VTDIPTSLAGIAQSSDLLQAARCAHEVLRGCGLDRTAYYRLTDRGLERLGAFDGDGAWADTPRLLSPVPSVLDPLIGSRPPDAVPLGEVWSAEALSGTTALPMTVADGAAGVMFVPAFEGPPAATVTDVASMMAACIRMGAGR